MATVVLALLGASVFVAVGGFGTGLLGLVVGALAGQILELRGTLREHRLALSALDKRSRAHDDALQRIAEKTRADAARVQPPSEAPRVAAPAARGDEGRLPQAPRPDSPANLPRAVPPSPAIGTAPAADAAPVLPDPSALPHLGALEPDARPAASSLAAWLTGGNLVAKIGVVILFVGVALLLRFAADRGLLPIEYRLMGVAVGALVMAAVGWRLRHTRRDYAMALQGGAIGILYLTIYAAFRLYGLLPPPLTFTLLLLVVLLSGVLAVAQNAMTLAVLGAGGGFAAPILASSGSGSHIGLFSYYLVLNAGIVGLAWFRSWRLLNWLGFVFTFGVGLLWGREAYRPELLSTTEPFLVAFFTFYVAVAVLFAHRQPPRLRGYIDGSLVFGVPAIAFVMQSALVGGIPFARAYSAVVVSALYLGLARWLWRRDAPLRPLAEAFLALGVVFLTAAIPFAFTTQETAAAWALEGAGLVWIGVRQQRALPRAAGTALQLAAGAAFGANFIVWTVGNSRPILNGAFLGCLLVSIAGLSSARQYARSRERLATWEGPFEWVLLTWGVLWWSATLAREVFLFVPGRLQIAALAVVVAASPCAMGTLARRWRWAAMMHATVPALPVLALLVLMSLATQRDAGPLANLGWAAWPTVLAAIYALLWQVERVWPAPIAQAWHAGAAWLLVLLAAWAAAAAVGGLVPESHIWGASMWAVMPAAAVLALIFAGRRLAWPVAANARLYATIVPLGPAAAVAGWVVWACTQSGDPAPLQYMPIVNPLELAQILGLATLRAWWVRLPSDDVLTAPVTRHAVIGVMAFLALNALVGRVVHVYLGVPYTPEDLARSAPFQAGLSALWALAALGVMTLARRRLERTMWIAGAGLLGILIVKLFLVDLGKIGAVARIVSFLVAGVLILVIGYLAPAPPRSAKSAP